MNIKKGPSSLRHTRIGSNCMMLAGAKYLFVGGNSPGFTEYESRVGVIILKNWTNASYLPFPGDRLSPIDKLVEIRQGIYLAYGTLELVEEFLRLHHTVQRYPPLSRRPCESSDCKPIYLVSIYNFRNHICNSVCINSIIIAAGTVKLFPRPP